MEVASQANTCIVHQSNEDLKKRESSGKVHPADGRWAWLVCFCGLLCNVTCYGAIYSFGVMYPSLLERTQESKAVTALVGSIALAFLYALSPLAALIVNRIGARKLTILGSLLCVLGLTCSSLANTLWIMFLTYSTLLGFGASCVHTSVFIIVPKYFKKRANLALGLISTGSGAGMMIFSAITGACLRSIGWNKTLITLGGICGAVCFFSLPFDGLYETSTNGKRSEIKEVRFPRLCRNWTLIIESLSVFVYALGQMTFIVHVGKYSQEAGLTVTQSESLYQVLGVCTLCFRVGTGYCIDRFRCVTALRVIRLAIVLNGIAVILSPLATGYPVWILLAFISGSCFGAFGTAYFSMGFSVVSLQQRGMAFGMLNFSLGVGIIAGPPLIAFLAVNIASYSSTFYLAGVMEILGFMLTFGIECTKMPGGQVSDRQEVPGTVDHALLHQQLPLYESSL